MPSTLLNIVQWINNQSIATRMQIIFWPAISLAVIFAGVFLLEQFRNMRAAQTSMSVVTTALKLDAIAHNHAVERGLTAGFLGSGGSKGADRLAKQREVAAQFREQWFRYTQSSEYTSLPENTRALFERLTEQLKRVPEIQQKIDRLDVSANAFNFYSGINKLALDGVASMKNKLSDPGYVRRVDKLLAILWLKERAGQERGALNGIFSKKSFDYGMVSRINYYSLEQLASIETIERLSLNEEFGAFSQRVNQGGAQQVEQIRTWFFNLAYGQDGDLSTQDAAEWFALSTARIKNIKGYADDFSASILSDSQASYTFASSVFLITLVIVLAVIGSLICLVRAVANRLTHDIQSLTSGIDNVNRDADYSVRIPIGSRDEIGRAADSFNHMLTGIQHSIQRSITVVSAVAKGDFSQRIEEDLSGDLLSLKNGINASADKVHLTMDALESVMRAIQNGDFSTRMSSAVEGSCRGQVDEAMRTIQETMTELAEVVGAVAHGDFGARINADLPGDLATLKAAVNESVVNIQQIFFETSEVMKGQAVGDFSKRISGDPQGQFLQIKQAVNASNEHSSSVTRELNDMFSAIACGDYSKRINGDMRGDFLQLKDNVNGSMETLQSAVGAIVNVANAQASGELNQRMEGEYSGQLKVLERALNSSSLSLKTAFEEITTVMTAVAKGDFSQRVSAELPGQYGEIKSTINQSLDNLELAVHDIDNVTTAQVSGDLTCRMSTAYRGSLADISDAVNASVEKLAEMIHEIDQSANHTLVTAKEQIAASKSMSDRNESQASSLQQVAASMEEMSSTITNTEQQCRAIVDKFTSAEAVISELSNSMGETLNSTVDMKHASGEIGKITEVIEGLAFQTNLLALNAAVEAARAGDQGRGFAVVASEVRKLAQSSSDAAKDISDLIKTCVDSVASTTRLAEGSNQSLQNIVTEIAQIREQTELISTATVEQATGVREVNSALGLLDQTTQQNAAMSEETVATAASLSERSERLSVMLRFFKTA